MPEHCYVKAITYGGMDVLFKPLELGSLPGVADLEIRIGADGGSVTARALSNDGHRLPGLSVVLFPVEKASQSLLPDALMMGKTNYEGTFTSPALAPGRYFVLISRDVVDKSPEGIAKLMASMSNAIEVMVAPNLVAEVNITQEIPTGDSR
jgi:hypothetical protein